MKGETNRYLTPFLLALLSQLLPVCIADVTRIPGAPTSIESDASRMISLRHQERMWQTGDQAIHILINRGALSPAGSLQLFSSFDSGQSWVAAFSLGDSDSYSTADGVLIGDDLSLAYGSASGKIIFSVFHYDNILKVWSLVKTETAFEPSNSTAINPGIVIDDAGAVWCAFVNIDNTSLDANIRLVQSNASGDGWQDTGLIFGATDNVSIERSVRPVLISNGVGMVYTVHEKMFWATRQNGWPANAPWTETNLFTESAPYDKDPYSSHFSIVADANRNLHMATVEHGQLLYFRYFDRFGIWSQPKALTADVKATYPQVTLSNGMLSILTNAFASIAVFNSTNSGTSFTYDYLLTHPMPPSDGSVSYDNPRVEAPSLSYGPIPVFQQYVDNGIHKLLYFEVPGL